MTDREIYEKIRSVEHKVIIKIYVTLSLLPTIAGLPFKQPIFWKESTPLHRSSTVCPSEKETEYKSPTMGRVPGE